MIVPPEVVEDIHRRAHAIVLAWLRGDVEGLVSLTGDDADELERQLDAWLDERAARLAG